MTSLQPGKNAFQTSVMQKQQNLKQTLTSALGVAVVIISVVIAYFIYHNILGDPTNFMNGDLSQDPVEGNYLGVVHKGGPIVILQISFMLILFTYIIERAILLSRASGKHSSKRFAANVKSHLNKDDFTAAIAESDKHRGSVANVVKKGLSTYLLAAEQADWRDEEKAYRIKRDLEEATHLEVPVLEKNMIILSTLASVATLIGLLGTVTGMIKAFAALARSGSPDAIGLASGISQALVTTALGISTAAVAIVFYNFYTNIIDRITYSIDETNYAILHHFKSSVNDQTDA